MGDVINIEEWKERKRARQLWASLQSRGYDIAGLKRRWEQGELFVDTHSSGFPVTVIRLRSEEL